MIVQDRNKRKATGGRYKNVHAKVKANLGRTPALTKIGARKLKPIRVRGSHRKYRLQVAETANLLDKKTKTYTKAKILTVKENKANSQFVRRNIITKGAIIETEKGKAIVTSRPGQDGTVNAILI
jgi:small subunit ribosomal protein S8e